jgi:hypothetical protein
VAGETMTESMETVFDGAKSNSNAPYLNDLLQALGRLDRLLERAVAAAQAAYGPEAAADPYRGLYINHSEVERLLAREPGAPILQAYGQGNEEPLPDSASNASRLAWLERTFGLSSFDTNLLLIALAPALDLRYERLYAYLQDDVAKKRPSVDLALNLLCPSKEAKLVRREHFTSEAPLIRNKLVHLLADPHQIEPPLLAHYLKLDDQIVHFLLGQMSLDRRLSPFCQLIEPIVSLDKLPLSAEIKQTLPSLVVQARVEHQPLRLYFYGPRGGGKRRTAEALACKVGTSLMIVDLARAFVANNIGFEEFLKLLFREAWFQDAILYLDGLDVLRSDERAVQHGYLLDTLAEAPGTSILAGMHPWIPSGHGPMGVVSIAFPMPAFAERWTCWQAHLDASGTILRGDELDILASRFRLTPSQIAEAVVTACKRARGRMAAQLHENPPYPSKQQPTLDDFFAAARAQSDHDLGALAHKIEPKYCWEDIVLPEDTQAQLREICQRVAYRHHVMEKWGFNRKLSLGKGVNALFAGPSGTGKTMAAEIVANELGLDLYKIDLSGVVSKYIGETEKNGSLVFPGIHWSS